MDPITGGLAIVGLGMQLFGGAGAAKDAAHAAEIAKAKYADEEKLNSQRQVAMEVSARRQNLEIVRNSQRARAMALQAATNQGAQFGSGLQGGLGQISGNTSNNISANNSALDLGRRTYGINSDISALNMQLSDVQSSMSRNQGIASLGSSLSGSAGSLGKIAQGVGGSFGDPLGGFGGSSKFSFGM